MEEMMNKEKVKVTTEQGRAMDKFLKYHTQSTLEEKVQRYITDNGEWINSYLPLRKMGFEKFLQALMFGYEVSMTPHEKIAEAYQTTVPAGPLNLPWGDPMCKNAFRDGIRTALWYLGISVEGVYTHEEAGDRPEEPQSD